MVMRRQTAKWTRRPHGEGRPRPQHIQMQKDGGKLCALVQWYEGLKRAPTLNKALAGNHVLYFAKNDTPESIDCNAVAVEIIPTIRPLENPEPCLRTGQGKQTATDSSHAMREFGRRGVENKLIQDLSRYYLLGQGQSSWTRPSLLSLGKHVIAQHTTTFHAPGLFSVIKYLDFSALLGPSNEPDP